jgi:hypothetical protein
LFLNFRWLISPQDTADNSVPLKDCAILRDHNDDGTFSSNNIKMDTLSCSTSMPYICEFDTCTNIEPLANCNPTTQYYNSIEYGISGNCLSKVNEFQDCRSHNACSTGLVCTTYGCNINCPSNQIWDGQNCRSMTDVCDNQSGFINVCGSCVKYIEQSSGISNSDARSSCESNSPDTQLMVIRNKAQFQYIKRNLNKKKLIRLSLEYKSSNWNWINRNNTMNPIETYQSGWWADSYPSNVGNCTVRANGALNLKKKLIDITCDSSPNIDAFVCDKSIILIYFKI